MNKLQSTWGPDAEEFRPELWLKDESLGGAPNPYDFMTSSSGPKSCIGERFARGENLALLAALVGRFEISLVDGKWDWDVLWGVTVKPLGLNLNMKALKGW